MRLSILTMQSALKIIILLLLLGCSTNKEKKYISTIAVVTEIDYRHWGKGYFKLDVYYKYFNGIDSVIGQTIEDGLERSYTSKYIPGDSILIGYNQVDKKDSYIVRIIYAKPRIKN